VMLMIGTGSPMSAWRKRSPIAEKVLPASSPDEF